MRFDLRVALRYLLSNRLQSALLIGDVAIARALMNQPALVLADEPTGDLDRENADQVFALMTEIQRETGTTFLLSTHDRELAERCGRRIYIRSGVIVDAPERALFRVIEPGSTSAKQPSVDSAWLRRHRDGEATPRQDAGALPLSPARPPDGAL